MSLGRVLLRRKGGLTTGQFVIFDRSVTSVSCTMTNQRDQLKNGSLLQRKLTPSNLNLMGMGARRGVKTTDTFHPSPVYDEDEKILKRVMEERNSCDDLPIGMKNPYEKPKGKCILCELGIVPNYKNIKLLYQFTSPYTGLPYEQHITGLCRKKHAQIQAEIRTACMMGMMSLYTKPVEFLKDPKLCDPERPFKPHKH